MYVPSEVEEIVSETGNIKANISNIKTFVMSIFAGMFVALGAFGSQITLVLTGGNRFAAAFVFPTGLFIITVTGIEVFTGNNLLVVSFLDKKITFKEMIKNWILVYFGNFMGCVATAYMVVYSTSFSLFSDRFADAVVRTANNKVTISVPDAVIQGILCNMLVCTAVWIAYSAKDVPGKAIGIYMPTMLFVLCGFEHCVANMYYIPAAILTIEEYAITNVTITVWDFIFRNIIPVTVGNLIGGAYIVGFGYAYLHRDRFIEM